jgi:hypothetical protein
MEQQRMVGELARRSQRAEKALACLALQVAEPEGPWAVGIDQATYPRKEPWLNRQDHVAHASLRERVEDPQQQRPVADGKQV